MFVHTWILGKYNCMDWGWGQHSGDSGLGGHKSSICRAFGNVYLRSNSKFILHVTISEKVHFAEEISLTGYSKSPSVYQALWIGSMRNAREGLSWWKWTHPKVAPGIVFLLPKVAPKVHFCSPKVDSLSTFSCQKWTPLPLPKMVPFSLQLSCQKWTPSFLADKSGPIVKNCPSGDYGTHSLWLP